MSGPQASTAAHDDSPAAEPAANDAGATGEPHHLDSLLDAAVAALGGQRREGQHRMARAVGDALDDDGVALVQAGTGTGKSLAYLVPAVVKAVRDDARIIVSTATLALQRQVYLKDLPLVVEALADELGERPRVALLKGRSNYLCRHKLAGGYPEPEGELDLGPAAPTSALGRDVARVHEWAETTTSGDRDDLVPGVSGRAWAQASVSGRECLGQKCPLVGECFAEDARDEARQAHIVVTNHAMLGIEATGGDVLGERDAVIVDEAHELVDRITTSATEELTVARVDSAARAARRCGVDTPDLDEAARAFDRALDTLAVGRLREGPPEALALALAAVRDAARAVHTEVQRVAEDAGAQAQVAMAGLAEVWETCEHVIAAGVSRVVWLAPPDGDYDVQVPARVLVAPLDVSTLIGSRLVDGGAAVLTSATLALGGTFDSMARALGVDDPATLDAGSPFDYAKQGMLYVARHLPRPGPGGISDDALDELAALIAAAGGRTLGLFSSHRAAQAATDAMRERLDLPIMNQRDDQVPTLVSQFREDPSACLFGSTTLWQGIDLPGDSCQLVVIDRIPFPRPDDPVMSARAEALDAGGGNGFMGVSATHAALLLAQGAGRLIRSMEDRGVVAVLDSRLATARYGGFLARSLPPLWPTSDRDTVLAALRRLNEAAQAREASD